MRKGKCRVPSREGSKFRLFTGEKLSGYIQTTECKLVWFQTPIYTVTYIHVYIYYIYPEDCKTG